MTWGSHCVMKVEGRSARTRACLVALEDSGCGCADGRCGGDGDGRDADVLLRRDPATWMASGALVVVGNHRGQSHRLQWSTHAQEMGPEAVVAEAVVDCQVLVAAGC